MARRRRGPPRQQASPTHRAYCLSEVRGERIQADVEWTARDAADRLAAHPA